MGKHPHQLTVTISTIEYTLEQRIKALEESDSERSDDPA